MDRKTLQIAKFYLRLSDLEEILTTTAAEFCKKLKGHRFKESNQGSALKPARRLASWTSAKGGSPWNPSIGVTTDGVQVPGTWRGAGQRPGFFPSGGCLVEWGIFFSLMTV